MVGRERNSSDRFEHERAIARKLLSDVLLLQVWGEALVKTELHEIVGEMTKSLSALFFAYLVKWHKKQGGSEREGGKRGRQAISPLIWLFVKDSWSSVR